MLNWLKRSLGGLLALCMLISLVPTALAADRSELEDHWASESLLYFADEGWLQGYKDGTYKPDSKISRAEFITILNRVCGFTERDDEAAKAFQDVKETDWYFEQVSIALAAGYTNGTTATTFDPNVTCTRAQIVTFIYRAAGEPAVQNSTNPFQDVKQGAYYKAILWAVENGITNGFNATTFSPNATCTRAQGVTFLYRGIGLY